MSSRLTKTSYLAGRQCARRLWLGTHRAELGSPPDAFRQLLFEQGRELGTLAHALFPGGVEASGEPDGDALARTRALVDDAAVPAIFEATFEHDGVRVRVDVLERLAAGFGIREIKSGAKVRDVHLDDVALQQYVLAGAGVAVVSTEIVHVDTSYVRENATIDWPRFFLRRDVGAEVNERLPDVAARIAALHGTVFAADAPVVAPSGHCFSPYRCEFWDACTRDQPADWIGRLPGLRGRMAELAASGVDRIVDLPDDGSLSPQYTHIRDALRSGAPFVSPQLAIALADLGPPAMYLDFETMSPAVPIYPGTQPFERMPFQWSVHTVAASGAVTHQEHLADGASDPRRQLTERLLEALGHGGEPILVYSSFESEVLADLAVDFPDLAEEIAAIRARLRDLLELVRAHVYHSAFAYSFSLKNVAPALAPHLRYDDLDGVATGIEASLAFARLVGGADPETAQRVRAALLTYCRRDTEALIAVHRALQALAGTSGRG